MASLPRYATSLSVAFVLACTTACSSVKITLQDASRTMGEVVALTESVDEDRVDYLYALEDHVFSACGDLFEAGRFALSGGGVPILTKVSALFSTEQCRSAVDNAEQKLEEFSAYPSGLTDPDR